MFDAKIQQVIEQIGETFGEKLDNKIDHVEFIFETWEGEFDKLSRQTKIAICLALGLSVADTILLLAILIKLGRR